jgi:hypothetical protein
MCSVPVATCDHSWYLPIYNSKVAAERREVLGWSELKESE